MGYGAFLPALPMVASCEEGAASLELPVLSRRKYLDLDMQCRHKGIDFPAEKCVPLAV